MLKSLPILGALGLLDNIDEWMNTEYPRWWRGIGGMVGADVVGPATVQLPASGSDLVGPALSDMGTIWTNIIKPLREGEKVGWRDVNKTAADIVPIWKHWYRMVEQLVDQDFVVKNDRGQKLYQIQDAEGMAAFVGRSAAGVESIDIAREKLAERIWNRKTAVLTKNKTHVIDDVLDTVLQGKPLSESQTKDIIETGVNRKSLLGAARFRQMTPEQRMLLKTEIRRRPELIQAFPWAFSAD
jgi:hypothetical protein